MPLPGLEHTHTADRDRTGCREERHALHSWQAPEARRSLAQKREKIAGPLVGTADVQRRALDLRLYAFTATVRGAGATFGT